MDNKTTELLSSFKTRLESQLKDSLIFTIITLLWHKTISDMSSDEEREEFRKNFISFWRKNVREISQDNLKGINEFLNENNADMINILSGEKEIADVEDYQEVIDSVIKETESIFQKITNPPKK